MPAFPKPSPAAVARFDRLAAHPDATRKQLFGCPVYELAGHRYATLYGERIALSLAEADRERLLAAGGAWFEPHAGRRSKDRVLVPEAATDAEVGAWIACAVRNALG